MNSLKYLIAILVLIAPQLLLGINMFISVLYSALFPEKGYIKSPPPQKKWLYSCFSLTDICLYSGITLFCSQIVPRKTYPLQIGSIRNS